MEVFCHLIIQQPILQDRHVDMTFKDVGKKGFKLSSKILIFTILLMILKSIFFNQHKTAFLSLKFKSTANLFSYFRCDSIDALQAYVHLDGRMEKLDSFCGSILPRPIMSNGPRMMLEFRGIYSSRYVRGFKASYSFTESKFLRNLIKFYLFEYE